MRNTRRKRIKEELGREGALTTHLPAGAGVGTPHHSHPSSAFGERAAPLVGTGVMLMLPSSGLGRAGNAALPTGEIVGNGSP